MFTLRQNSTAALSTSVGALIRKLSNGHLLVNNTVSNMTFLSRQMYENG